jgi:steroid 5-alpha reductase family enzyme
MLLKAMPLTRPCAMFETAAYLQGLLAMALLGLGGWLLSVMRRNITLVDSLWSLFFLVATLAYLQSWLVSNAASTRAFLIIALVSIWALRLAIYLARRNRLFSRNPHEDRRYQAIRQNNEPHFWLKSLYIVFGLQALLAWIISLPLLGAIHSAQTLNWFDMAGLALWLAGFAWECIADWQLARFKADPANKSQVMDSGPWRYSRHPNYFGECCLWWGYYLIAVAAGAWWALPAPLVMTLLLLKVSGVALLEKDIAERRPAYADYVQRTNAFLPGPRRNARMQAA